MRLFERTAGGQQASRIACFKPLGAVAVKELVIGVQGKTGRIGSAAFLVCGGLAALVHGFQPPPMVDQIASQIIEQLRMRGRLARRTELVGRGHDSAAEMVLPEPVDDDPRQQVTGALLGVGEPMGQRRASIGGAPAWRRRRVPMLRAVTARIKTCK